MIQAKEDCFGRPLNAEDEVLSSLQGAVSETDADQFSAAMDALLQGCVRVLERQLADYITGDLSSPTPQMLHITKSAPVHNIASERILGLTDSQYRRAPNATIGFIDAKVKGKKNKTLPWLKSKPLEEQDRLISYAVCRARKYQVIRKEREAQTTLDYQKRLKEKIQKKDKSFRGKVERKIEDAMANMPEDFESELLSFLEKSDNMSKSRCQSVVQMLQDPESLVGKYIYHIWDMGDEGDVPYCGQILELKVSKKKPAKLRIAYWLPEEMEEDSADSSSKISEALTDYLIGDLTFSTV